jgi:oxaloacetate decarboxylase (Na+ extruding) subunit alpha
LSDVHVVDTSLRDGNQSLWGAMGMSTATVLGAAPVMASAGYEVVELINSTIMGVAVRSHREDPWERIRLATAALGETAAGFLTTGRRFIAWERAPDAVMELAFGLLVRNGIRRVWIVDPMNDVAAALRSADMAKGAGAEEVVVGLIYSVSPVHSDAYYAERAAALRAQGGLHGVYLKDPGGLLTPDRLRTLVPAIREGLAGGVELRELHSHCNTGLAPLCYLDAVELGVRTLHCASTPLANGTSQPSVERVIANLRERGHSVGLDEEALREEADYFRAVARRDGFPTGVPLEYDESYFRHQVPGGMVSTLRRQLDEVGMVDRLPAVLDEVAAVRRDFGYPIMVTPLSQFVGAQAVLNVVGDERYGTLAEEVVRYLLGDFGDPPAPLDADLLDRVERLPRSRRMRVNPDDDGLATLEKLRGQLGRRVADEELLLRAVMRSDEVDGIRSRAHATAAHSGQGTAIKDLLRGISRRGEVGRLRISKPGFRMSLERAGAEREPVR